MWAAFASASSPLPAGVHAVIVTRGVAVEVPAEVAQLSGDATVVMSDDPWSAYEVHSGPFFVYIDGATGRVLTEGVAWSVAQIRAAIEAVTTH